MGYNKLIFGYLNEIKIEFRFKCNLFLIKLNDFMFYNMYILPVALIMSWDKS